MHGMNAVAKDTRKIGKPRGRPFQPGNPGKPKGAKAKVTKTLREAVLLAGEQAGNKLEPNGGMVAYLRNIAETQPQLYMPILGRVLPLDVTSSDGSMRPVVALYMPDNRRDGDDAKVIEHAKPAQALPEPVEDKAPDRAPQCPQREA